MNKFTEHDQYFIPKYYSIRESNTHDDERKHTDRFQLEVYLYAKCLMNDHKYSKVIDVGCGSGYKLVHYLDEFDTLGIETEPCYSFLKETYPDRKWHLSGEPEISFPNTFLEADLVLCVDVIEHIRKPEELIKYLLSLNFKHCIISTPDRHVLSEHPRYRVKYAQAKFGPPVNSSHVREWGYDEFICFLSQYFNIVESHHGKKQLECQWHLCTKK